MARVSTLRTPYPLPLPLLSPEFNPLTPLLAGRLVHNPLLPPNPPPNQTLPPPPLPPPPNLPPRPLLRSLNPPHRHLHQRPLDPHHRSNRLPPPPRLLGQSNLPKRLLPPTPLLAREHRPPHRHRYSFIHPPPPHNRQPANEAKTKGHAIRCFRFGFLVRHFPLYLTL